MTDTYYDPLSASAGVAPPGDTGLGLLRSAIDWWQRQPSWAERAQAVRGDPNSIRPTQGLIDLASEMVGPTGLGIKVYHGSPHDFPAFDISKIGTGEGAQVYGHGLYFAENPAVAQSYREALAEPTVGGEPFTMADPTHIAAKFIYDSKGNVKHAISNLQQESMAPRDIFDSIATKLERGNWNVPEYKPGGHMYEADIAANPEHFINWDHPLTEAQANKVNEAFPQRFFTKYGSPQVPAVKGVTTGQDLHDNLQAMGYTPQEIATTLRDEAGIPGIRYADQLSRRQYSPEPTTRAGASAWVVAKGTPQEKVFDNLDPAREYANTLRTHNYVLFDDKLVSILKKFGLAGLIGGGYKHFTSGGPDETQ